VVVPLHDSAWAIINDGSIHNYDEAVFSLLAGTKTDTNKYLIRWTEKAGIQKHITWHAARRTCPSLLHEMGADIYTIQKICGHAKIETTAIYTRVSDRSLREAVNALPSIEVE
jgi:site-specific recombinase XerD